MSVLGVLVSENRRLKEALQEIIEMPSGRHVTLDSERPWDTSYVLDGHERCVEVAKRALGIHTEQGEAHPLDLYALGKRIADEGGVSRSEKETRDA